jgi:NADH dehydrogenase (ubiquinone) 1 beta subcomplex subunit 8
MLSSRLTRIALRTPVPRTLTLGVSQRHQWYSSKPTSGTVPVANSPKELAEAAEEETTDASQETYPDVPAELYHYRDPDAPWDDKQNRRNFGEPLNIDDDELNMWSPHYYDQVSDMTALKWQGIFFGTVGAFSALVYFFFYPERNATPRSFPDGLAKDLGARNEEDAHLYRIRSDKTFYESQ